MVSPPSTSSFPAVRQLEGVGIDAFALQVEYLAALVSSIGDAVALRLPQRNQAAEPGRRRNYWRENSRVAKECRRPTRTAGHSLIVIEKMTVSWSAPSGPTE